MKIIDYTHSKLFFYMTEIDASTQVFSQAAILMMVGMGFVFAFLSLLIVAIKFLIAPLATRFPDLEPPNKVNHHKESQAVVAAISAAIKQYRQKHLS
jgi:oxaloacetate decarboxylase gamma subunit